MVVFDVTDRQSFDDITQWFTEGDRYASSAVFILVGNKRDKAAERNVTTDEAKVKEKEKKGSSRGEKREMRRPWV